MTEQKAQSESNGSTAVVLVGHGRKATDTPSDLIEEYQRARQAPGDSSLQLHDVETRIRNWPRTADTDPYKTGLQRIANALADELPGTRIAIAFNEFCAPSIHEAVAMLVDEGVQSITLVTTMFTPGGNHAERDLPAAVEMIRETHPDLAIRYVWPFPLKNIASFLAESIAATEPEIEVL
jgi:sirohydrochlorin cobaltochelatase